VRGVRSIALVLLAAAAAGGCSTAGGKARLYTENAVMPDMVAVLLPSNSSNDLAAPDTMRKCVAATMVALGYLPVVSTAQEEQLRLIGVTDGGQMKAIKPEALSGALGTDGLLYTDVETFSNINIGVYKSRHVVGTILLSDAKGNKLWNVWGEVANRKVTNPLDTDAIARSFVEGMAEKWVQKLLKIHLLEEAGQTAIEMSKKTPEWPDTPAAKATAIRRDLPKN